MSDATKNLSVGIVILAAGASIRMGMPKQLLHFQGQTLLRRAAKVARQSVCHPVIIVLGAQAAKIRGEVADLDVMIVENQEWAKGISSSIRAGVNALESVSTVRNDAAVLMLCDQPFIASQTINRLVEVFYQTECKLVVSTYDDTHGVPALFERTLFPELLSLEGETGAKQIINKHLDEAESVAVPEAVSDVDTPQDYKRLKSSADSGQVS